MVFKKEQEKSTGYVKFLMSFVHIKDERDIQKSSGPSALFSKYTDCFVYLNRKNSYLYTLC